MAQRSRVAVFDKTVLVGDTIFNSMKDAKAANKGSKGLTYVKETEFTPIGQYATVTDLFPVASAATASEGKVATVSRAPSGKLTGAYTFKSIGRNRTPVDDPRADFLNAMSNSSTFEEYFSKCPESVTCTTERGNPKKVTAEAMMKYAVKMGWVEIEGFERRIPKPAAAPKTEITEGDSASAEDNGDEDTDL